MFLGRHDAAAVLAVVSGEREEKRAPGAGARGSKELSALCFNAMCKTANGKDTGCFQFSLSCGSAIFTFEFDCFQFSFSSFHFFRLFSLLHPDAFISAAGCG